MRRAVGIALAFLIAAPAAAAAGDGEDAGAIVFARGHAVYRVAADGSGKPTTIAKFGVGDAPITRLAISRDHSALLLERGGGFYWAGLRDGITATPAKLPCAARPRLSSDGRCVACLDDRGRVVLHRPGNAPATVTRKARPATLHFRGPDDIELVAALGDRIVGLGLKRRGVRTLAPHRPSGALLPSPDGTRAVGVYDEAAAPEGGKAGEDAGDDPPPSLYVFRLDGKAARRRVGWDAVPVAWSGDSRWVLYQSGESACLVRAIGGEYKCWRGFTAVALSHDGTWALLSRAREGRASVRDLYRAPSAGVRPKKPRRILGNVRAAVWRAP